MQYCKSKPLFLFLPQEDNLNKLVEIKGKLGIELVYVLNSVIPIEVSDIDKSILSSGLSVIPRIPTVRPEDVDISSFVTKTIKTEIPLLASPMDTVIGYKLCVALLKAGGVPILHPFYGNMVKLKIHLL